MARRPVVKARGVGSAAEGVRRRKRRNNGVLEYGRVGERNSLFYVEFSCFTMSLDALTLPAGKIPNGVRLLPVLELPQDFSKGCP